MIFEFENLLNDIEIINLIEIINNVQEYSKFTDNGLFENKKWIDTNLAKFLFSKIKDKKIQNVIRPNKYIMYGKFNENDLFSIHTDTGLFYDKKNKEASKWTFLVYLNDNFIGGNTVFYDENWNVNQVIIPKKGKGLLFDMSLWHSGERIIQGTKMWIGCEIIGKI